VPAIKAAVLPTPAEEQCPPAPCEVQQLSPTEQLQQLKDQGSTHFAAGDYLAAECCWQQCLEIDADNSPVLANLCFLYLRMSQQQPAGSTEQRSHAQAAVRAGKQVLAQPGVEGKVALKARWR
jgi:hypothetical protein